MSRVLVTEEIAQPGLDLLAKAGHEVDVRLGLSPAALLEVVPGASALVIRSATKVTEEVLAAGRDLAVVGRAGIGLDNVDVPAATRRGVTVVNAPQSNILSAAEHTMGLLLAQARNIPQAHSALKAGRWERSRWEGVELYGKTLGIIGLGRVGTLVAQRALAFGMHLVAYDPYLAHERARQIGVELVPLEDLVRQSDFVTIHLPKTPETMGLVSAELLAAAKPGLRLVNTARGGIVDEDALARAISDGRVAGASLDVFAVEPPGPSPLLQLDEVVVTPHLGASTREAQDKAGVTIAEQVVLALAGDIAPFAVNVPAAEVDEVVRPFVPLAERLGRLFASLAGELPGVLEIEYAGPLASHDTRLLTLATQKGLFSAASDDPVSYVNVAHLAAERGLEVRATTASASHRYINLVLVRGGERAVGGTLFGQDEPRIVLLDEHEIELPFARWLLVVRNDNRVGMVALVTSALAGAGININDLHLGRSADRHTAIMAISLEEPVPEPVIKQLRAAPGILEVMPLSGL
ncbi:MAG: phosphoglycerate dehydrogenase [Acidimicrobiales bacterium]